MSEPRLKIALFIDFDNIEIGVKTTLGGHFDVGAVLEAMKERGEVVTKIAYGDWTRAGDYSRSLTQHAIQMVQRNLTPGGDKNGADINLALDALEMAFTHSHINAFVIVGGDSDFMALVEKLKLYDRQVFVIGGRAFTSVILQKNCTEFIAYENLIGRRGSSSRGGASKDIKDSMPLVKRALKVLADREVTPQLGVLKSTLLQLDSTFSEREYGVSTFRDFVQKLERAGQVTLRGDERSLLVELRDTGESRDESPMTPAPAATPTATPPPPRPVAASAPVADGAPEPASAEQAAAAGQHAEGYAVIRDIFLRPGIVARWPLYVRQAKQVIRSANEGFDERRYGFNGIVDALRFSQREGLFRLDRDRQGVIRIYPGPLLVVPGSEEAVTSEADGSVDEPAAGELFEGTPDTRPRVVHEGDDLHEPGDVNGNLARPGAPSPRDGGGRRPRGGRGRGRGRGPVTLMPEEPGEVVDQAATEPAETTAAPLAPAPDDAPAVEAHDGELFPEPDAEAALPAEPEVAEAPATVGARKTTRKRAAKTTAKKAVKKTARKSSR